MGDRREGEVGYLEFQSWRLQDGQTLGGTPWRGSQVWPQWSQVHWRVFTVVMAMDHLPSARAMDCFAI